MTHKEYFKFFNQASDMIDFLIKLQQLCEEMYISDQLKFEDEDGV